MSIIEGNWREKSLKDSWVSCLLDVCSFGLNLRDICMGSIWGTRGCIWGNLGSYLNTFTILSSFSFCSSKTILDQSKCFGKVGQIEKFSNEKPFWTCPNQFGKRIMYCLYFSRNLMTKNTLIFKITMKITLKNPPHWVLKRWRLNCHAGINWLPIQINYHIFILNNHQISILN